MNNNKIKRNSNNSVYILYKEVMVPIESEIQTPTSQL